MGKEMGQDKMGKTGGNGAVRKNPRDGIGLLCHIHRGMI